MKEIRTAFTLEELQEVQDLLQSEGIYCQVYQNVSGYETIYNSNPIGVSYKISVPDSEAQRAFEILEKNYGNEEDEESFLRQMDTVDLLEILAHPQKYSTNDYSIAQKLILERGISSNELEKKTTKIIKDENTPQRVKTIVLLAGYIFAVISGILGFAIGWYLYFSKTKHTQTGKKYFAHDKYSRRHGLLILVIGFIALILLIFFQFSLIKAGSNF